MSAAGKKRKHGAKMAKKRSEKSAKRAKYAALAGTSKKNKNQRKNVRTPSTYKHAHIMANCGNPGCKKCHHLLVGNRSAA